jgi:hypothetical protein
MRLWLLALLLAAPAAAPAADSGFDGLVKAVETRFGVHRTHVPFLGVANFFVKVARPEGARSVKLAIFEDFRYRFEDDDAELDQFVQQAAKGMSPLVRVHSRRDHEASYVYMAKPGKISTLLIATFERREASIIEVKVDMNALNQWLQEPARMGKRAKGGQDRGN